MTIPPSDERGASSVSPSQRPAADAFGRVLDERIAKVQAVWAERARPQHEDGHVHAEKKLQKQRQRTDWMDSAQSHAATSQAQKHREIMTQLGPHAPTNRVELKKFLSKLSKDFALYFVPYGGGVTHKDVQALVEKLQGFAHHASEEQLRLFFSDNSSEHGLLRELYAIGFKTFTNLSEREIQKNYGLLNSLHDCCVAIRSRRNEPRHAAAHVPAPASPSTMRVAAPVQSLEQLGQAAIEKGLNALRRLWPRQDAIPLDDRDKLTKAEEFFSSLEPAIQALKNVNTHQAQLLRSQLFGILSSMQPLNTLVPTLEMQGRIRAQRDRFVEMLSAQGATPEGASQVLPDLFGSDFIELRQALHSPRDTPAPAAALPPKPSIRASPGSSSAPPSASPNSWEEPVQWAQEAGQTALQALQRPHQTHDLPSVATTKWEKLKIFFTTLWEALKSIKGKHTAAAQESRQQLLSMLNQIEPAQHFRKGTADQAQAEKDRLIRAFHQDGGTAAEGDRALKKAPQKSRPS